MAACFFCEIAQRRRPAEIVLDGSQALAFLDIYPSARGHTLVIPRAHAEHLGELDDALIGPLFQAVKRVTALLQRALGAQGFTVGLNHGRVAGQHVPHLHVHIIPRYPGDRGTGVQGVVRSAPNEPLAQVAAAVRRAAEERSA